MNEELYLRAIDLWGRDAQIIMAIEEMAELTDKLTKFLRGREVSLNGIAEEIADVRIMLEQLDIICVMEEGGLEPLSQSYYDLKIERLSQSVDEEIEQIRLNTTQQKSDIFEITKKSGSQNGGERHGATQISDTR